MRTLQYIIITFLFLSFNKAQAQKNLVSNAGFENDTEDWTTYGSSITPYDFKNGKSSCVILAPNTEKWLGLHQIISIPKKAKALEFSAWLKTINVIKGFDDWSGAVFNVEFLDNSEKKVGESISIARITGDQGWELSKKSIKIPVGAVRFKVLAALGYASGTLFIDDVSVKVVDINALGN